MVEINKLTTRYAHKSRSYLEAPCRRIPSRVSAIAHTTSPQLMAYLKDWSAELWDNQWMWIAIEYARLPEGVGGVNITVLRLIRHCVTTVTTPRGFFVLWLHQILLSFVCSAMPAGRRLFKGRILDLWPHSWNSRRSSERRHAIPAEAVPTLTSA